VKLADHGTLMRLSGLAIICAAMVTNYQEKQRRPYLHAGASIIAALRTYVNAQSVFRKLPRYGGEVGLVYANPRDGVGFPDLYQIGGPGSGLAAPKLIDSAFAVATSPGRPRRGYYFVDILGCWEGGSCQRYDPAVEFGLCAVPAEYGVTGTYTYIMDITGATCQKDTGGTPVRVFPDVEADGWVPAW
jgi:hypothetical protein